MDYLFAKFKKIEEFLRKKFILLLLDYDGTLVPIAQTPQKAVMPQETKELLRRLSRSAYCKIGIISGRPLEGVKNTVGVKDIIYAGNHGLEIAGPKIKFRTQLSPGLKALMRHIAEGLKKQLSKIKGVLIEDKGLTISVHYRLVAGKDMQEFLNIFRGIAGPYIFRNKIKVGSGKKVYEIKPPIRWDKGKVVLWLMARQQFIVGGKMVLPVYIGDDVTDEDAFKALKRKGLTIFVGRPGNSGAGYYLKDTKEVTKFLRLILKLKNNRLCQT